MQYLPYSERKPSSEYKNLLGRLVEHGEWVETRQGPRALTLMQQTMTFPISNGFPMITERSMASFWHKPIGELCAFINGVTTADGLREFGCDWWGQWTTAEKTRPRNLQEGDIGPGSYGGAFHDFPTSEGESFDQFKHLVEQIIDRPVDRTHFVTPWIPQYQVRGRGKVPRTTIAPCHGWVHLRVLNDRLHLHMYQRSGDVPVGVPSNMIQYGALLLMIEQLTGVEASTYYHTISDAHIYEDQLDKVRLMLAREPSVLPTLRLTEEGCAVKDIHDFRASHFTLSDYHPHAALRVPVAT